MFETVRVSDWLTIIAILVGPIAAVIIQLWRENRAHSRNAQESILGTLMTNRGTPLNYDYVKALNSIDIAFHGETGVTSRWAKLNAHLNTKTRNEEELRIWSETTRDLTAELLVEMGKALGYNFDFTALKSSYVPTGHGTIEGELDSIRRELLEVLDGKRRVPVAVFEQKFPDVRTANEK